MKFNEDGILDSGIHAMIWDDFYTFFSFSPRRKELLEGLKKVIDMLQEIGCTAIYIDGSFVTAKLEPGDWDACFDCPQDKMRYLSAHESLSNRRLLKRLYKGDLFSASSKADQYGTKYLEFFQQMKNSVKEKGIVKISLNKS